MRAISIAMRARSKGEWHSNEHYQNFELGGEFANSITSVQKDSMVLLIYEK